MKAFAKIWPGFARPSEDAIVIQFHEAGEVSEAPVAERIWKQFDHTCAGTAEAEIC